MVVFRCKKEAQHQQKNIGKQEGGAPDLETGLQWKLLINILQFESSRLSMLQLECNKLLDKFYSSKEEFDFLIKDSIRIKYIGEEDSLRVEEYIKEFSTFFMNVWQVGKLKFSEKGKRMKYICFVGKI
ncbi:hypothetical protein J6590_054508 [Homalodisca vitripennis]|nr:hypothetical protein J6590_054508 [Homalodisca vitripennis]